MIKIIHMLGIIVVLLFPHVSVGYQPNEKYSVYKSYILDVLFSIEYDCSYKQPDAEIGSFQYMITNKKLLAVAFSYIFKQHKQLAPATKQLSTPIIDIILSYCAYRIYVSKHIFYIATSQATKRRAKSKWI
jgi:hypothetical protein